jgi:hypothetical protein
MKNIHLLPTEDKGRITKYNKELHIEKIAIYNEPSIKMEVFNMYITSDEEITGFENNIWVIKGDRVFLWQNMMALVSNSKTKKIILTTDQDLIADGVQAIDDEFLEWFVKNPTCEYVEVKHFGTCCGNQSITQCINCEKYNPIYKITIPKEEPKQETLEEAAKRTYQKGLQDDIDLSFYDGVRLGAKWQQERMYSEVFEWLSSKDYLSDKMEFIQKEFEKFKKKD